MLEIRTMLKFDEKFVSTKVESGRYNSASDVVREGRTQHNRKDLPRCEWRLDVAFGSGHSHCGGQQRGEPNRVRGCGGS